MPRPAIAPPAGTSPLTPSTACGTPYPAALLPAPERTPIPTIARQMAALNRAAPTDAGGPWLEDIHGDTPARRAARQIIARRHRPQGLWRREHSADSARPEETCLRGAAERGKGSAREEVGPSRPCPASSAGRGTGNGERVRSTRGFRRTSRATPRSRTRSGSAPLGGGSWLADLRHLCGCRAVRRIPPASGLSAPVGRRPARAFRCGGGRGRDLGTAYRSQGHDAGALPEGSGQKTHRGLEGRVRNSKSAGGISYGLATG